MKKENLTKLRIAADEAARSRDIAGAIRLNIERAGGLANNNALANELQQPTFCLEEMSSALAAVIAAENEAP